jgi:hypothetical protein
MIVLVGSLSWDCHHLGRSRSRGVAVVRCVSSIWLICSIRRIVISLHLWLCIMVCWLGDWLLSHVIPRSCWCCYGHVHGTLRRWWVRTQSTATYRHSWRSAAMSDQVDSATPILAPEIDHEHEVSAVDVVWVNLSTRFGVAHDQANARRRGDWPSILVTEPAHSGPDGLLFDYQSVSPSPLISHTRCSWSVALVQW